jgi:hypothetical protein
MIVLLLGCGVGGKELRAHAQDSSRQDSEASVAASEDQLRTIRRELRSLKNHDWAGEYYYGDGLGVNVSLALAPESGFVFRWDGCLGMYDLNYGAVAFTNGTVRLLFRYPNVRKGFQGIAPELLPVRWGERHYLIPMDGIVDFTNEINAGTEPSSLFGGRSGRFPLRRGDDKKKVSGQPNLPNEYLSYLLAKPIKAKITSIGETHVDECCRFTSVTLDVGSADGLKKGMELHVHSPSSVFESAVVTVVSEHSAQAVIEQQMALHDPVPVEGWSLSTKL